MGDGAMMWLDLIWVGNTLLPRWLVYAGMAVIAAMVIGAFVILIDGRAR
jgi:hypothetical protein